MTKTKSKTYKEFHSYCPVFLENAVLHCSNNIKYMLFVSFTYHKWEKRFIKEPTLMLSKDLFEFDQPTSFLNRL